MAHFAELDDANTVLRVIVVSDDDCLDQNGDENEPIGALFCHRLLGGRWVQTSYNARFRMNYAGIGFVYDEARDAFIPPRPSETAVLDGTSCLWIEPDKEADNGSQESR